MRRLSWTRAPKKGEAEFDTILCAAIFFALVILVFALPPRALAQTPYANSPQIFDMRKSLPLEPDEPVYHDYYISTGSESGLKKGAFVNVVRSVPIHDPIQNKQRATLNVSIGRLQIIQVEKGMAVGRLATVVGNEDRPSLEFEGIFVGDRVDLGSMTMEVPKDFKKGPAKPKRAAHEDAADTGVAVSQARPSEPKPESRVDARAEAADLASSAHEATAQAPKADGPGKPAGVEKAPVSIPIPPPKPPTTASAGGTKTS